MCCYDGYDRLEAAEKKVYDSKCTFAPVIAAKPIKKKKTDSDDEVNYMLVQCFVLFPCP